MFLYKSGEIILKQVLHQKGSIKNLVFASKYKNPKQLYALVCETLKYLDVLEEILKQTKILNGSKGLSKELIILTLYDFLFGKGVQCSGKLKKLIMSRKTLLHSTLARIKVKHKVIKNEDLANYKSFTVLPKYLRVNTLKKSLQEVQKSLESDGYIIVSKTMEDLNGISIKEYALDTYIPNLLVFNPRLDFHSHQLYLQGHVIFQDRSSCLPSQILCPPCNSQVIDACAAPGNKTSHLAALMKNTGKIYAFDLSFKRIKTMKSMLEKAGVFNCEVKHSDFLEILPSNPKYHQVTHILLDPSCSGSGIVNRLDHLTNNVESSSADRLLTLSKFQLRALNHALSFPSVLKVVYSTCSVHEIENECVIKQALERHPEFSLQMCMPIWERRGKIVKGLDSQDARKCIRCDPKLDCSNGFFVALLQRNSSAFTNNMLIDSSQKSNSLFQSKRKKKKKKRISATELVT